MNPAVLKRHEEIDDARSHQAEDDDFATQAIVRHHRRQDRRQAEADGEREVIGESRPGAAEIRLQFVDALLRMIGHALSRCGDQVRRDRLPIRVYLPR